MIRTQSLYLLIFDDDYNFLFITTDFYCSKPYSICNSHVFGWMCFVKWFWTEPRKTQTFLSLAFSRTHTLAATHLYVLSMVYFNDETPKIARKRYGIQIFRHLNYARTSFGAGKWLGVRTRWNSIKTMVHIKISFALCSPLSLCNLIACTFAFNTTHISNIRLRL